MIDSFASLYSQAVARVASPLSPGEGYQPDEITAAARRIGVSFPLALQEFYGVLGRRQDLLLSFNRVRPPHDCFAEGKKVVFAEENQQGLYWAFDVDGTSGDPEVLVGGSSPGSVWRSTGQRVSGFLVCFLYWQAVMGGRFCAWSGPIGDPQLFTRLLQTWRVAATGPGLQFLGQDGELICICGGESVDQRVYLAGRSKEAYRAAMLKMPLSVPWVGYSEGTAEAVLIRAPCAFRGELRLTVDPGEGSDLHVVGQVYVFSFGATGLLSVRSDYPLLNASEVNFLSHDGAPLAGTAFRRAPLSDTSRLVYTATVSGP